jgi:trans-aconitate 2-methyltransferase
VTGALDWDADAYTVAAAPHLEWANQVLERLELNGDETILDAGCGSGHVTALVLERIPEGRLIGIDASESMIESARKEFADDPRVELQVGDLLGLDLEEAVDAVFSSAVFHWILDHDTLFSRLYAALRPGGRLEFQCGGEGNIAEVQRVIESLSGDERFAPYLRSELKPWNYAGVGPTETRLQRAGFDINRVWLQAWPVVPPDPREFLRTVILPWHLERLPANLHEAFLTAILETMPRPFGLRYVRLNVSARRPSGSG